MVKYTAFVSLLVTVMGAAAAELSAIKDYYWREFDGIIPPDALVAGFDANGMPVYIGQVLSGNKLIPGKIYSNDTRIYYEFGEHAWTADENIRIFCTPHPNNYEWVAKTTRKLPYADDEFLVRGGFEKNFVIYIGRIYRYPETLIGKVVCRKDEKRCLALYVNENGQYREYRKFEVLQYNGYNVYK